MFNLLDNHGIGWENYVASYPTGATPELFLANDLIPEALHHTSLDDFFTAAANGALPPFSILDPDYSTQSQENPQNIVVGEALLAQVVDALGSSPLWEKSILLVMYDEYGGYYDHVPPPAAIPPDIIPRSCSPARSSTRVSPDMGSASPRSSSRRTRSRTTSATWSTTTRRCWRSSSGSGTCPR